MSGRRTGSFLAVQLADRVCFVERRSSLSHFITARRSQPTPPPALPYGGWLWQRRLYGDWHRRQQHRRPLRDSRYTAFHG